MGRSELTDEKKKRNEGANKGRFAGRLIFIIPIALALLLVLIAVMYYTPMRIWYREARQQRVLLEQKAAIDDYNDELRETLLSLETTEGIRQYAYEELGLVEEGDRTVVVIQGGRPLQRTHDTRQIEILDIPLTYQPFGAWTPFLDRLFGIELPG
jgi:flagellar basal body-associated protein FliL